MSVGLGLNKFLPRSSSSHLKLKGSSNLFKLGRDKLRTLIAAGMVLDQDRTCFLMAILSNQPPRAFG